MTKKIGSFTEGAWALVVSTAWASSRGISCSLRRREEPVCYYVK